MTYWVLGLEGQMTSEAVPLTGQGITPEEGYVTVFRGGSLPAYCTSLKRQAVRDLSFICDDADDEDLLKLKKILSMIITSLPDRHIEEFISQGLGGFMEILIHAREHGCVKSEDILQALAHLSPFFTDWRRTAIDRLGDFLRREGEKQEETHVPTLFTIVRLEYAKSIVVASSPHCFREACTVTGRLPLLVSYVVRMLDCSPSDTSSSRVEHGELTHREGNPLGSDAR